MSRWSTFSSEKNNPPETDSIDPFHFNRRETARLEFSPKCIVGPEQPPRVIVRTSLATLAEAAKQLASPRLIDTPGEGLLVGIESKDDLAKLKELTQSTKLPVQFLALEISPALSPAEIEPFLSASADRLMIVRRFQESEASLLKEFITLVRKHRHFFAMEIEPENFRAHEATLREIGEASLVFTLSRCNALTVSGHATGAYRHLVECLKSIGSNAPIWIRNTTATAIHGDNSFLSKLLEASFLTGSLLCDGVGDFISIETETDVTRAAKLSYNVLQGAGARISKTEFVACPSCGRTLFDLQSTTQRIRAQTGHLKGVKIAIMGCIVNGPGEMADADFGYVGGAPGKINLYVGKNCVQYNIPQAEADARLVELIREHGKWADPEPHQLANA